MTSTLEVTANAVNAISIGLAALNNVNTWWTGIVGCLLFGVLFFDSRLYADATLQVFFIVTSVIGWWGWLKGAQGDALPVRTTPLKQLGPMLACGVLVTAGYGWLLHRYTNAYAPFADSAVLALSVLAQLLLMSRRYEAWWGWLATNTLAVPLFLSRGLNITAALYAAFWINAVVALVRWRRLVVA